MCNLSKERPCRIHVTIGSKLLFTNHDWCLATHHDYPELTQTCDPFLLYQFLCHIISNDNVKSRLKSNLTINHFLDLSMHNHPFVLSHNNKCAHDNYHCIKGPRDIITFTQSKRDKYYFDNLTALDIIYACRQLTFIVPCYGVRLIIAQTYTTYSRL